MKETLLCHECDGDAVGTCRSCGKAFCGGHGADYCRGCATAIVSLEPHRSAPRQLYLQCVSRPRMPTVYLDDDGPPTCFRCDDFARHICQGCHNLYCTAHGNNEQWCEQCQKHSLHGTIVTVIVFGTLLQFALCMGLLNWLGNW